MKSTNTPNINPAGLGLRHLRAICLALGALLPGYATAVTLGDAPLFSTIVVPGNLALALSVEWPTATTPAYTSSYSSSSKYLGYFDPGKCYRYIYNRTAPASSYFSPDSKTSTRTCTSSDEKALWSGNYLNWASMQTLDGFRWVMTGGYRSVDTATETTLTKTYAAATDSAGGGIGNNKNANKTLTSSAVDGATPFTYAIWTSSVKTRTWAAGTSMYITSSGDLTSGTPTDYVAHNSHVADTDPSYAKPSTIYRLYINVRVCDASVGVEDNCVAYGGNYKPEGLMQKYASKLRYSAFGYYNDTSYRDGGVMRARMKFIGPTQPVPGSAAITNAATEWRSTDGTMVVNPDSSDADATSTFASAAAGTAVPINNSGVMNYLNKFGYDAHTYKGYDPVSELYYAATRYFRYLGNVSSYTSLTSGSSSTISKWLDGFPAITTWDDPILYSCQKNFILGIGDVNCHRDTNLPNASGGKLTTSAEPSMPAEVTNDDTVDVVTATNMVGQLEGKTGTALGGTWMGAGRGNAYYIAGLAYDAHTKDIRSDLAGTQTINTYWVDVSEDSQYQHKNQFWLAAKYGGFTAPDGFSPYAASNGTSTLENTSWYTSSDTLPSSGLTYANAPGVSFSTDSGNGTDKRTDNYFTGNSPDKMKDGLTAAFDKIATEATSASSTSLSSPTPRQASSGNVNYSVEYNSKTWTSTLKAQSVSYASDGTPTYTQAWEAGALLDARSASSRTIVTCCTETGTTTGTTTGAALPFTYSALTSATLHSRTYYQSFGAITGVSTSAQSISDYVDYLRGNRTNELSTTGGKYRARSHLLGDIVNSKLTAVGAPSRRYYEVYNPGYRAFKSTYAGRTTVAYVGANDGMMHAFNGSTSGADAGKELFAYIPSFTYGTSTTAAASGLASLGNPSSFSHHYLVDGTPVAADVDFSITGGTTSSTTHNWKTILVGGLGKGGKGYYAIDITDPSLWTSESAVAGKVLWEFTSTHMGYSFGDAIIVKTPQYGWTVVVPSGYNNDDGNGYLYFLNPRTGEVLETITMSGSGSALNLANFSAFIPDITDFTADALYATDLQGNVWRVGLTKPSGSDSYNYVATRFATLKDSSGIGQPITTPPKIEADPSTGKRYVLVGTGQLLSDDDINSGQVQSFYAIVDGTSGFGKFYTDSTLPSGVSFPITRSNLEANTNLINGIGDSPSKPMGWYFDLSASGGIAERINVPLTATSDGIVGFAANLPNGNACSPAGTSKAFAVSFADGKSAITINGSAVSYVGLSYAITDIAFRSVDGTIRLLAGTTEGTVQKVGESYAGKSTFGRLNWRGIPTAD
jgi:type IV pilus assembly protein PilY1